MAGHKWLFIEKDLFAKAGLEPPTSYANIVKAVNVLSSNDMFGFVAATKTDENFGSMYF